MTESPLNHFSQSHMTKLLEADLQQIVKMMDELKIHHRLSLNINFIRVKQDKPTSANYRQGTINTELNPK